MRTPAERAAETRLLLMRAKFNHEESLARLMCDGDELGSPREWLLLNSIRLEARDRMRDLRALLVYLADVERETERGA